MEANANIPTTTTKPTEKADLTQEKFIYKFVDSQAHIFEHSIRNDVRVKYLNSVLARTNLGVENIDWGITTVNDMC